MNPNTVFSATLVTSLVLWFPSMQASLRGNLDLAPAGLRYLAALFVSRLAMNGLARLVNAYRAAQHLNTPAAVPTDSPPSASPAAQSTAAETPAPSRRRTDNHPGSGADPASLAA